ncbi:MAG: hypothetical protein A3I61_02815 [Acidobacteria bacterium RIFCSPLOWO2_02_FULL_68_18]|nr:MAG: hypothetical protein A3I61_02815 [Acidobacteria bacterium RIFCSPLOWO2_02_FULL_68_18]OFW48521.1 MAG: hypothetical protein A3G77_13670 [Acidobacteria bacterium RIFCSPLOWO2_12_FULL_68_19]
MNFARLAAAALIAWIVSIGIGFLVNAVLLRDLALANAAALRPEADVMGNLPVGFAFLLLGFFAFAYAFAKGYEGGNGVLEGIRFGVVVAFIVIGFGVIWQFVVFPISPAFGAAIVIDSIVELAIYGAIVGAIYRPVGLPA